MYSEKQLTGTAALFRANNYNKNCTKLCQFPPAALPDSWGDPGDTYLHNTLVIVIACVLGQTCYLQDLVDHICQVVHYNVVWHIEQVPSLQEDSYRNIPSVTHLRDMNHERTKHYLTTANSHDAFL